MHSAQDRAPALHMQSWSCREDSGQAVQRPRYASCPFSLREEGASTPWATWVPRTQRPGSC